MREERNTYRITPVETYKRPEAIKTGREKRREKRSMKRRMIALGIKL